MRDESTMRIIGAAYKPFLTLKFNSRKNPSIVQLFIGIGLHGMSSRTYTRYHLHESYDLIYKGDHNFQLKIAWMEKNRPT